VRVWKSPGIGIRSLEEEEETGGAPHQAQSLFRLQLKEETMLNPRKERETRESAPSGMLDRTLRGVQLSRGDGVRVLTLQATPSELSFSTRSRPCPFVQQENKTMLAEGERGQHLYLLSLSML
jgi:hypothetical protein